MKVDRDLYQRDIYCWAEQTVSVLRQKSWDNLDLNHLIEEIEDLSRRERDRLLSSIEILLLHLLKWKYQGQKRSRSWKVSIDRERINCQSYLEDTPSLKQFLTEQWISKCYQRARKKAASETNLDLSCFPSDLPFRIDEILRSEFFPCSTGE